MILIHQTAAVLTIAGFMLRGIWSFTRPSFLRMRVARVLPHVVDTIFLLSGIGLIMVMHLRVVEQGWLLAKLFGLLVYIGLGMLTLRPGIDNRVRLGAYVGALLTFAYIAGAAIRKSPYSWLASV